MGMDVAAGDTLSGWMVADTIFVGAFVAGRVFVDRMYVVGVARTGVAVLVSCRILVGMVTVFVAIGTAAKVPGRRMKVKEPQMLSINNRLRQPMTAVPARLEFKNLLLVFIPFTLSDIDRAVSAIQIIS